MPNQPMPKADIAEIIENSQGKLDGKQWNFLMHVSEQLPDGFVSAYDFAEQIKRLACKFFNLHHGYRESEKIEYYPLAKDPVFENVGNFVADIREIFLQIFPENFANATAIFLPQKVRNQIILKKRKWLWIGKFKDMFFVPAKTLLMAVKKRLW